MLAEDPALTRLCLCDGQMWSKFQEQKEAQTAKPTMEALFCQVQQTTELNMGMGLPFNVNGSRRQLPWMSDKVLPQPNILHTYVAHILHMYPY
eukprot:CAMPEP_0180274422 /NCGR_PEP_ID=MMETSP0988-20121125/5315_1 /TAXON_ID=697907 /ORGANISM="non described non described, Strain CCMP2293" /LENGTH=92 /DNA_ID=CAMNT_0022245649 /DNA_START=89 /DNA_END=367 /DNA_ORIENTATION=-